MMSGKKFNLRKYRVIHLPTTVGGSAQGLSEALNKVGFKSETWTLNQNLFNYHADKIILKSKENIFSREIKKILALIYILKCDLAFFNYGSGLFKPVIKSKKEKRKGLCKKLFIKLYEHYTKKMAKLEIYALKILKKKLFVQFQGDDLRQGQFCKKHFKISPAQYVEKGYYKKTTDLQKVENAKLFSQFADKIYAVNPDLLYLLPKRAEFLPYAISGVLSFQPSYPKNNRSPLRIGHAPSHRFFKGTEIILRAIRNLKAAGFKFEFVLVEGRSNQDAIKIYQTLDILIDQLLAGWYGRLAVEAMALGKPVLAYIREDDLHFIPPKMKKDLPIIKTNPFVIEETLKEILKAPRAHLTEIGKKSRRYVEVWHNPLQIARRVKMDMEEVLAGKVRR